MWSTKVLHVTQQVLYYTTRFPAWGRAHLERVASVCEDPQELSDYSKFAPRCSASVIISIAVHIVYVIKNFLFVGFTLLNVDFYHLETNLQQNENNSFKFVCLRSDCRQAVKSHQSFLEQLVYLPVFKLCNPKLSQFYSPHIQGEMDTLILVVSLSLWAISISVLAPCALTMFPNPYRTMIDIVCPKTGLILARDRIKVTLERYGCYKDSNLYYAVCGTGKFIATSSFTDTGPETEINDGDGREPWRNEPSRGPRRRLSIRRILDKPLNESGGLPTLNNCYQVQSLDVQVIERSLGKQNYSEDFVEDCLLLNSSREWHHKLPINFCHSLFVIAILFTPFLLYYNIWVNYGSVEMNIGRNKEMLRNLSHNHNCSIWVSLEQSVEYKLLPSHDHFDGSWTFWNYLEQIVCLAVPLCTTVVTLNNLYIIVNEFRALIHELHLKALVICESLHLSNCIIFASPSSVRAYAAHRQKLLLEELQARLGRCQRRIGPECDYGAQTSHRNSSGRIEKPPPPTPFAKPMLHVQSKALESIQYNYGLLRLVPLAEGGASGTRSMERFLTSVTHQQIALEILVRRLGNGPVSKATLVDLEVELIEKMFVKYMHLFHLVKQSYRPFGNMLLFSQILTYALSIILVYFYQYFKTTTILPLVQTIFSLSISFLIISWCSLVQTDGVKLEMAFWSLIAHSMRQSRLESRIARLRDQWLNQLDANRHIGGIVIKAFGVKVTCINIIQLLIWTSTILLFAYQKHN